ncbi:MAG: zf-HC2 domain-containing protein [Chitinophagaceae bacterium]
MNCDKDKGEIIDYIGNQMPELKREAFELHLTECASCREELSVQQELWNLMGELKVPAYSSRLAEMDHFMIPDAANSSRTWLKIAAAFILVLAGFAAGYLVNRPTSPVVYNYKEQVDSLSAQMHDMKEIMMLSMLENPSASERIKAVGYTSEINIANNKTIEALLTTLNNDPNVNVRLVTLEALTHYAGDPVVREGLVQSIIQQQSPQVQAALADAMLKLQEKKSINAFKKLLQQKELNNQVRTKIEQTISRLI